MTSREPSELVLGIYPFCRGLAFALFEGPLSPIDWAVKDIRSDRRNALVLEATKELIERYQPDVLVLQAHRTKGGMRGQRIRRLDQMIATYAAGQAIECHRYTREEIRTCFRAAGAVTRYEIAQAIAAHVPALSHRLPPMKKLWQSEDRRMGLFDAASLVMTYFCNANACSSDALSSDE
jgi:hypothetical protein